MQTKDPPKRVRSSGYDVEIAETICDRLVNGESLSAICAILERIPIRWKHSLHG